MADLLFCIVYPCGWSSFLPPLSDASFFYLFKVHNLEKKLASSFIMKCMRSCGWKRLKREEVPCLQRQHENHAESKKRREETRDSGSDSIPPSGSLTKSLLLSCLIEGMQFSKTILIATLGSPKVKGKRENERSAFGWERQVTRLGRETARKNTDRGREIENKCVPSAFISFPRCVVFPFILVNINFITHNNSCLPSTSSSYFFLSSSLSSAIVI